MTDLAPAAGAHSFDWVDDVIFILDSQERFTFVNAFALRAWNRRAQDLLGQTFEQAVPQKATQEAKDAFRHALRTQERTEFDTFGARNRAWFNVAVHPHQGGVIVHVKRLLRHAEMTVPSTFDALTGCLTRAAFQIAMQDFSPPYVLAVLDLNLLKSVNTLHGHGGGDKHIRTVAHALREALPAESLLCRWGGDEFVILVPGSDQETLRALLCRTNGTLARPVPDTLAFTVGMAVREQGMAFERAFAVADEHLQLQKEHLKQATASEREAASFVTFSQELEALREPGELIQHALDRLLNLLDFDQAIYAPWEGEDNYASHQAYREGVSPLYPPLHVRVSIAQAGLVHQVQRTRSTAWSTDYMSDVVNTTVFLNQGVKSVILTPVFSQGQIIATIVLRAVNRWQTITPHMRKVVELTALRLEHALELRRAVNQTRSTLEAGLLALGVVLEARDLETQGHTTRAADMAASLGASLGLTSSELGHLRQGAYLHDLGKFSVPDEILKKPGKFTPEEWAIMKGHVQQGHDLATRIPGLPQDLLDIIRSHHERWDGSGYPDGLSGTDIPLGARIFAVCDVYDALISERPYKHAWSPEEAVSEIERESGRHFDPEVVRAFLGLAGRGLSGRDEGNGTHEPLG
ncbi:HD domain-containing phosphohydrolase [Deinococcus altitudinis]|uniref:sensor domain-containing diguanylate cyclase/phosphohydrolase n=1 Tax=Deinococcus altitudinis TaxID=468914 RepID=UPI003892C307